MLEKDLADLAARTQRRAGSDFVANVFEGIGIDRYATVASALGDAYVVWSARGVAALRLATSDAEFEAWYSDRFSRRAVRARETDATLIAVRARLRGEEATVALDLSGSSAFESAVLRKAAEIPPGHARPYWWIARELHAPGAQRAVGNALARNPVPLLVPCHRVIRADFNTGDYVFGRPAKRRLLTREGLDLAAVDDLTRRGTRYVGCDDGTFCLPTCGDVALKTHNPGYVELHSLDDAHGHRLAPCPKCRPIAA